MKEYYDYLQYELNYSQHTIDSYVSHVENFLLYIKTKNIDKYNLKKEDILGYLKYLDKKNNFYKEYRMCVALVYIILAL